MNRHDAKTAKTSREPDAELDRWAHAVVGAALAIHRALGPGFLESVYEEALCVELQLRDVPLLDLLIGNRLVVELKAVEALASIHVAQVLSYLKTTGLSLGLLINFNVPFLQQGLRRIVLSP